MINFLYSLGFTVSILIIWFKSDVYVEYCKLFGLNKFLFGYDSLESQLTFPQYLYTKRLIISKNKIIHFYIKLITCPICISFWLSLLFSFLFLSVLFTPLLYVCTLFVYLVIVKLLEY
jgi:hypothetical protein